jgi:membrane protein
MKSIGAVIREHIWRGDLSAMHPWKAWLTQLLRVLYVVTRDLTDGQLTLRAMSLVYTTLLSLVPLLAVSFSVLKGFGVHNQIEPLLLNFLAPLGPKGAEITGYVIGFVENMRVGVLGSLGLGLLLYTVVSLIQKIEQAFNFTWHTVQDRSVMQRFSNYLSVILVGPVLMFTAVGMTASVKSTAVVQRLASIEPFGTAIKMLSQLVPYLLVIAAFTFMYAFIPNARVRLRSALVGGVIAGVAWEASGWGFATFVASSTRYTAIYSGFAILIMFMTWLYLSWLILLLGASIAFYHQRPERLTAERQELRLSSRLKEKLALLVMFVIGRDHYGDRPTWTMEGLATRLGVPMDAISLVIETLERHGMLTRTDGDPPGYVPPRALETIHVKEVLDAVRSAEEGPFLTPDRLPAELPVDELLSHIDQAVRDALEDRTLKQLALSDPSPR